MGSKRFYLDSNGYEGKHLPSSFLSNIFNSKGGRHQEELIDFKKIASLLARHKWIILFFLILFGGSAYYLAFHYLKPVYQSTGTLLITASQNSFPGSNNDISKIISSSYQLNQETSVITEVHFLKSRELASEVAGQIATMRYQPDGNLYPLLWDNYPEDSTIVSHGLMTGRISDNLSVEPIEPGSNILEVSYESYSPYEAARAVNLAINFYQEMSTEKRRASARSALLFLKEESKKIKDQLDESESQLSKFMNKEKLVQLDSQTNNLVNSLSSLESERQSLAIQLESVNSAINNYEKQIEAIKPGLADRYSKAIGPTISKYQERLADLVTQRFVLLSNNPQLKDKPESEPELKRLNNQISQLRAEIQKLSDSLLENNDSYIGFSGSSDGNITQEITNIQNKLTELRIQKSQYQAQISALNGRIEENRLFLDQVPENRIQLERLQRKVSMYEELFMTISQQTAQVTLWEQTQSGSGTILDHATVSYAPIKPQKELWLGIAILLGFFLPVGFFIVTETLSNKINSVEALRNDRYPLLSVIYSHKLLKKRKKKSKSELRAKVPEELVVVSHSFSPIAETYRRLVNNLVSSKKNTPRTIMVTSPGPSEGKTTMSANIAAALVETGKRVLIIDCDMRRPGLHRFFKVHNDKGLVNIIENGEEPAPILHKNLISNLSLLTSGKLSSQPVSILNNNRLTDFVSELKSDFDVILLDTPPFGIINDAAPLFKITDEVLVVVKFGETRKPALSLTLDHLEKINANVAGLILNGYIPDKSFDDQDIRGLYNYTYKDYYEYHRKS